MKFKKPYKPPKLTKIVLTDSDCPFTGRCIGRSVCGDIWAAVMSRRTTPVDRDDESQLGRSDTDQGV